MFGLGICIVQLLLKNLFILSRIILSTEISNCQRTRQADMATAKISLKDDNVCFYDNNI